MQHLDFQQLTEAERIATYGAFFAMAVSDGSLDDEELIHIFECLDLEGMSEQSVKTVRSYLIEPPALLEALEPLTESDNDVRYGVLVHLMDVALADSVYAPGERKAISTAAIQLGANEEQVDAIEAFIREVRGITEGEVDEKEAKERLQAAHSRLDKAGVPTKSLLFSGSVAALSAGGVGAAVIAGLGVALVPGIGLAVASGTAAFFAMNLALGRRGNDPEAAADVERVIHHLQAAITETLELLAEAEAHRGGTHKEAQAREEHVRHLNKRVSGMQRLLAKKRHELA
ncbi:MAG: hypothetical protein KC912_05750 [Proteobacteria bacterium]|nr:hypothetical protein [Pseudomonadota bacterium]